MGGGTIRYSGKGSCGTGAPLAEEDTIRYRLGLTG